MFPAVIAMAIERAGPRRHHSHPVVAEVGDRHVARAVHRHAVREVEAASSAGRPSPKNPCLPVARDSVDVPGVHLLPVERAGRRRHDPDALVERVGDHQIARGVQSPRPTGGQARPWWPGRRRRRCRPRRPCRCARRSSPGRRTCRSSPPPPAPGCCRVGDDHVARAVHRHALREAEFGAGRRAAVTGEPRRAVTGDRVDVPGGHRLAVERARSSPPPAAPGCSPGH